MLLWPPRELWIRGLSIKMPSIPDKRMILGRTLWGVTHYKLSFKRLHKVMAIAIREIFILLSQSQTAEPCQCKNSYLMVEECQTPI